MLRYFGKFVTAAQGAHARRKSTTMRKHSEPFRKGEWLPAPGWHGAKKRLGVKKPARGGLGGVGWQGLTGDQGLLKWLTMLMDFLNRVFELQSVVGNELDAAQINNQHVAFAKTLRS